ncbi:MAG TPA: hypothetical protein VGP46_00495, partial [Acidimicrobiales bacterium]|nr:hypothetical protein [Acidimicrobiales bacterium]
MTAGTDLPADRQASELVNELLDRAGARANRDLLRDLFEGTLALADGIPSRLDLKIAASALREMSEAFHLFAPFRGMPKLTMFGSARTLPDDPLYLQARRLAE